MNDSPLALRLKGLSRENLPRFGSFGEYVFVDAARAGRRTVEPRHEARVDFVVDGISIDVKASARGVTLKSDRVPLERWNGRRKEGVAYARVEFLCDGARVSVEGETWGDLIPWSRLERLFTSWTTDHRPEAPRKSASSTRKLAQPILDEVRQVCQHHGRRAHVIYRTCMAGFGMHNPPDNMVKGRGPGVVHVFVSFHDENICREKIAGVYAIPDEHVDRLPRQPIDGLSKGEAKINLEALGSEYVYRNLDDFRDRFFRLHRLELVAR